MDNFALHFFQSAPLVVILGTNEIASAVAVRLRGLGCQAILSQDPFPPVIRRGMAFHDALYDDQAALDGVLAARAETFVELARIARQPGCVAVTPLHLTDLIAFRTPDIVVDARMQKDRITPDLRGVTRIAIGLGPNFVVGENCDLAIETHPASTGRLVERGGTQMSDGVARKLGGVGKERFRYAATEGIWRTPMDIGMRVFKGLVIGHHNGAPVRAPRDGVLRGIARDGVFAPKGVKLLEVDSRGRSACWTGSDARGRQIAEATVAAIALRASAAAAPV